MSHLIHLVGSNEIERKERTKLYTLDSHAYLNLFTSLCCRQMGEKFLMTFISIQQNETQMNNVSKRIDSHSYRHSIESDPRVQVCSN